MAAFLVEDVKDTSCEQRFPLPSLKWSHSNWSTRRTTGPLRIVATTSLPRLRRQNSGQAPSNRCFHVFPGVKKPPATEHNKTPPVGLYISDLVTRCILSSLQAQPAPRSALLIGRSVCPGQAIQSPKDGRPVVRSRSGTPRAASVWTSEAQRGGLRSVDVDPESLQKTPAVWIGIVQRMLK